MINVKNTAINMLIPRVFRCWEKELISLGLSSSFFINHGKLPWTKANVVRK